MRAIAPLRAALNLLVVPDDRHQAIAELSRDLLRNDEAFYILHARTLQA
jgi:hypothetical protein